MKKSDIKEVSTSRRKYLKDVRLKKNKNNIYTSNDSSSAHRIMGNNGTTRKNR